MARLIIRFDAYSGGGGIITWEGDRENQAVFWELVCVERSTGYEWPPAGTLKYDRTHTDKTRLCTNPYTAPEHYPTLRYGTYKKYGDDHVYFEPWPVDDKVTAKWLS